MAFPLLPRQILRYGNRRLLAGPGAGTSTRRRLMVLVMLARPAYNQEIAANARPALWRGEGVGLDGAIGGIWAEEGEDL